MRGSDQRHETWIISLIMSARNLPTPPPEGPAETHTETPTEAPTETDHITPPATGAEEAPASTNPSPPQPHPTQIHTIYREVFPVIVKKVNEGDWSGLAMLAEIHDLRVCCRFTASNCESPDTTSRYPQTEHDADASRLLLTTPLVLSYLILDDTYDFEAPGARFPLNFRDQSSCPVRIKPSSPAAPTPSPDRRPL